MSIFSSGVSSHGAGHPCLKELLDHAREGHSPFDTLGIIYPFLACALIRQFPVRNAMLSSKKQTIINRINRSMSRPD